MCIVLLPLSSTCRSSFSEFALRYGKDERFKVVEKMREREQLFSDYLQELKKAGKQKGEGSTHSSVSRNRPDKVQCGYWRYPFFPLSLPLPPSHTLYSILPSSSLIPPISWLSLSLSSSLQTKSDFMDMLHEDHSLSEASQWKKVKGSFERDPRYRAVPGSSQREEWFKEHIRLLGSKVRGGEGGGKRIKVDER